MSGGRGPCATPYGRARPRLAGRLRGSSSAQFRPMQGRAKGERGSAAECHRVHLDEITMKIRRKDHSAPVPDGDVLVDVDGGDGADGADGTDHAWEPEEA
jgi:hypothetical protein